VLLPACQPVVLLVIVVGQQVQPLVCVGRAHAVVLLVTELLLVLFLVWKVLVLALALVLVLLVALPLVRVVVRPR
jgi:hypothetical protein